MQSINPQPDGHCANNPVPPIGAPVRVADGVWRLTGAGRDIGIEIRSQSVQRFADARTGSSAPNGDATVLASNLDCAGAKVLLKWTLRDIAVNGREAIRQEFSFEGTPAGRDVFRGTLSVKIVAGFLRPKVVLADTQGDAVMSRHEVLTAIPAA